MGQNGFSSITTGIPNLEDLNEEASLAPVIEPEPAISPPCSVFQEYKTPPSRIFRPVSPELPRMSREDIYIQIPSNMIFDEINDMVHNQDQVLLNLDPDSANDTILKFNQELGPSLDVVQSTLHISQLDKDQSDLPEKFSSDGGYYSMESLHSLGSCPSPNTEHPNTGLQHTDHPPNIGLHPFPSTQIHSQLIPTPAPIVFEDRDSLDSLGDNLNNCHRIATFDDNEELEDFLFAKKSAPLQLKARKSTKERDSRKIQQLEARERENEEVAAKIENIERCRNYRNNRRRKLRSEETELEQLERKNCNLKSREQEFTERINRLRVYYLSAIKNGRFKCCNYGLCICAPT
jgi:hypothetical protein